MSVWCKSRTDTLQKTEESKILFCLHFVVSMWNHVGLKPSAPHQNHHSERTLTSFIWMPTEYSRCSRVRNSTASCDTPIALRRLVWLFPAWCCQENQLHSFILSVSPTLSFLFHSLLFFSLFLAVFLFFCFSQYLPFISLNLLLFSSFSLSLFSPCPSLDLYSVLKHFLFLFLLFEGVNNTSEFLQWVQLINCNPLYCFKPNRHLGFLWLFDLNIVLGLCPWTVQIK